MERAVRESCPGRWLRQRHGGGSLIVDVIPVSDQASKVQRCRRAADLERQHGHFVDDPLLNGQPVQLPE